MWAGKYNEPIEVWDIESNRNAFGEQLDNRVKVYETRAKVIYTGGLRGVRNSEIQTPYTESFIVRIYVPVTDTSWIKWKDKFYRVTSIDSSREYQEITLTTELVNE